MVLFHGWLTMGCGGVLGPFSNLRIPFLCKKSRQRIRCLHFLLYGCRISTVNDIYINNGELLRFM